MSVRLVLGDAVTLTVERPLSGPVLLWPGAKWRLAPWIVSHLPPHAVYVEPFAGSAAVLLHKPESSVEIVNDLDGAVVNLFRVLRESPAELAAVVGLTPYARAEFAAAADLGAGDPVEQARRFLVRTFQGRGPIATAPGWRWSKTTHSAPSRSWDHMPERIAAVAARLRRVQIEQRPALDVIVSMREDPRVLIYADPPYLASTRSAALYRIGDADGEPEHGRLLDALVAHAGPVVLSAYPAPFYDARLAGWRKVERPARTRRGPAIEVLWLNPAAAGLAGHWWSGSA